MPKDFQPDRFPDLLFTRVEWKRCSRNRGVGEWPALISYPPKKRSRATWLVREPLHSPLVDKCEADKLLAAELRPISRILVFSALSLVKQPPLGFRWKIGMPIAPIIFWWRRNSVNSVKLKRCSSSLFSPLGHFLGFSVSPLHHNSLTCELQAGIDLVWSGM